MATLQELRTRSDAELADARDRHARVMAAPAGARDLMRARGELDAAEAAERSASVARAEAEGARDGKREELRRTEESYRRAAKGLADVQAGIEELHFQCAEPARSLGAGERKRASRFSRSRK